LLVKYSDWKRPIDGDYAFVLRRIAPLLPAVGAQTDIRQIAREVLVEGDAERFDKRVERWTGPEDLVGGARPYQGQQLTFEERGRRPTLNPGDVEAVLRGTVQVFRSRGQVDYLLRDHHMLDVALYHYRTSGQLPRALFHADRHSDWCKDSYLEARTPAQAATWWKLFEGLKRPGDDRAVLGEGDVFFATGRAASRRGRDVAGALTVPSSMANEDLSWERALEKPGALGADWVSVDLDFFQPAPQLRLASGLVRDPRFHTLMLEARVRVFVLSPQFTSGGDKVDPWIVQGGRHSSLRLLNLFRRVRPRS
jgi:hypothetical protein